MSFARRQSLILPFMLAAALLVSSTASLAAAKAGPSKPVTPKLSAFHARVGQGGKVDLAASTLTPAELAAMRPDYEKLKPRARSNAE